jgi:hypothetical protein
LYGNRTQKRRVRPIPGFAVKVASMDGGYDTEPIHGGCIDRGILPVTPLRQTSSVKRGEHKRRVAPALAARRAPCCRHGTSRDALIQVLAGWQSP